MNYKEIFSVIDILGAIPSIILIRQREGRIHAEATTVISGRVDRELFLPRPVYSKSVWPGRAFPLP